MSRNLQQIATLTDPQPSDLMLVLDVTVPARATDGVVVSGLLSRLLSVSAQFAVDDTGRFVTVEGAGTGGSQHVAVATFVNATTLTLNPPAITPVANATVFFAVAKSITIAEVRGPNSQVVEHVQAVPAAVWVIAHSFGRPPNVVLLDADGQAYLAAISHNAPEFTEVRITHDTGPEVGAAYLT